VPADHLLLRVQMIKTDAEIPYILEAYRIPKPADEPPSAPPDRQCEVGSRSRRRAPRCVSGRRGHVVSAWFAPADHAAEPVPLDRAGDPGGGAGPVDVRAKYMGYAQMCRPFAIGHHAEAARQLRRRPSRPCTTLPTAGPDARRRPVDGYYDILARHGYENSRSTAPPTGPAAFVKWKDCALERPTRHQPNMLFTGHLLSDGKYGCATEDGVLVTKTGLRELNRYRREVMCFRHERP